MHIHHSICDAYGESNSNVLKSKILRLIESINISDSGFSARANFVISLNTFSGTFSGINSSGEKDVKILLSCCILMLGQMSRRNCSSNNIFLSNESIDVHSKLCSSILLPPTRYFFSSSHCIIFLIVKVLIEYQNHKYNILDLTINY